MRSSDLLKPKRIRIRKSRCRTCRSDNGKRRCPALNGIFICPECCRAKRAKIPGCDAHCKYYQPLIRTSRIQAPPDYPVHKCYISHSQNTGMQVLVIVRKRPDQNFRAMFLLLDFWKKGIRDCFVSANLTEKQLQNHFRQIGKSHKNFEEEETEEIEKQKEKHDHDEKYFEEIAYSEAQKLIRYAYDIAEGTKTDLPWEFKYWRGFFGDLSKVPAMGGSLYKCPQCHADLPDVAVDLIKQYAQSEDIQFYILCRKCGGEFD